MDNLSTDTWRFDVGLACWDFQLGTGDIKLQGAWRQKLLTQRVLDVIGALNNKAGQACIVASLG